MADIVSAHDLHRRYGEGAAAVDALDGVSVSFEEGRFSAIMGPSGSGKSTLMHILAGLDRPTSGTVELAGTEITGLDDGDLTKLRRDKLGFIFQFFNLIPVLTAEENLVLPLSIAGPQAREPMARAPDRHGRPGRPQHAPSLGALRRPAAARGRGPRARVAGRPSCSRTSPPATSTRSASEEVLRLLRQAVDEFGQTVVMVTHEPEAASYADRLVVLRDGALVSDAAPGCAAEVIELMKSVA